MNELWSDDEEDVGPTQLTINEHYAKAFAYRKEREELERLKAKYGSDYDPDESDNETDSESAESEDEHGEELTPAVDAAILRTLARIKKKDPEIYNSEKNIFGDEREKVSTAKVVPGTGATKSKSKSKPVTIKQVNLDAMLNPSSRSPSPEAENPTFTYAQEQEALRKETIAAFQHAAETAGDEDDFLIPREKTKDEQEREEEEYRAFLEREVGDLKELVTVEGKDEEDSESVHEEEAAVEGKKKKKRKSKKAPEETPKKSKAEADQEFLLNYILNRGWIDKSEGHVPTYHEVTEPAPERRKKKQKVKAEDEVNVQDDDDDEMDTGMLSDTSFESLASHFEASYNHRFEEPGAATIPSFPRNLPSLVRREDTTRKDARARKKERKAAELEKKREEVRRMKALKMRDVKRKLEQISKQGGLKLKLKAGGDGEGEGDDGDGDDDFMDDDFMDEALRELDLEGEWDPEKHDRQMAGLFDRGADAFEDEIGADEDEDEAFGDDGVKYDGDGKPIWEDDVDIGDIPISDDDAHIIYGAPEPSKKDKKKKKKKGGEDDPGVDVDAMDADIAPAFEDEEEWDGSEEMRKRIFNKYMDEIYGLDFNDMVGEMPTRFKYVPVQPQNYALTPAEILMATDQELNEYMSVKKYAPYREDKNDRQRWNPKSQEKLREIKSKVNERSGGRFSSHAGGSRGATAGGEDGQAEKKKRMGKKERMKLKAAAEQGAESIPADTNGDSETAPASPKKRKHEQDQNVVELAGPTAQLGQDEGDGSGKKKRKRKQKKRDGEE